MTFPGKYILSHIGYNYMSFYVYLSSQKIQNCVWKLVA